MQDSSLYHLQLQLVDPPSHSLATVSIFATWADFTEACSIEPTAEKSLSHSKNNRKSFSNWLQVSGIDMYYKGAYTSAEGPVEFRGGILHLFRDNASFRPVSQADHGSATYKSAPAGIAHSSDVLAILAVPSYVTTSDLLGYLGESVQKVSHLRMIRTAELSRYMVLLKFRYTKEAIIFREKFNGAPFNPYEPETVHCVSIGSISFEGSILNPATFPSLTNQSYNDINISKTKPNPPTTARLTELPTCVVCLERMDSTVTGLLTISCEHTFHCECISRWVNNQSTCPICRFSVAREMMESSEKACVTCGSDRNLWMCLICGNIACGRYESQHAIKHSDKTQHSFAMDLESGRIWDYASDSYVHRIVQEKLEAKPATNKLNTWDKTSFDDPGTEFEELLAAQLESQRIFFEEQVRHAVDKATRASKTELNLQVTVESLQTQVKDLGEALNEMQRINQTNKEHELRLNAKTKTLASVASKIEKQYREERAMNESLMVRLSFLEKEKSLATNDNAKLHAEISELNEQVRDLMIHFSSQAKIEELSAAHENSELQDAQLSLGKSIRKTSKSSRKGNAKPQS